MITSGNDRLIEYLTKPVVEEVPKGWKTAKQLSAELGRSPARVLVHLKEGIEAGLVKKRYFKIKTGETSREVMHFFIETKKRK